MLTRRQVREARRRALEWFEKAGILLTDPEKERIEVADFGLSRLDEIGIELLTYVNTRRVCAKELVLFPRQTCAEHRHPPVEGEPGKEETFRCRWGEVYLHLPGPRTERIRARVPEFRKEAFTVSHEVVLRPGDQVTIPPDTLHWFQGGDEGAVVSEWSTRSRDEADVFSDPLITRITKVEG